MNEGRTKNTIRNTTFSTIYKLSESILAFFLRSLFIKYLGTTYLGLSGLFTNILTVLSLMDLGLGSAIAFSLYKPIAEDDRTTINALTGLYKRVYTIIGVAIAVIGVSLTSFLPYLVKLPKDVPEINLIYWLCVANTSISYFYAYRRTLFYANQRSDIIYKNDLVFKVIRFATLLIVLFLFKNYILYLAFETLITFASNLALSLNARKKFRYLEVSGTRKLEKSETSNIVKYMSAGIFNKVGLTVVSSTDNILISSFISTILVGLYSNYLMVIENINLLIYLMFSGVTASVGNFAVSKSSEESCKLFKKLNLLNWIAVFVCSVGIYTLVNPFIMLWLGKDFLLDEGTVAVLSLNFYIAAMQNCTSNFMSSIGKLYYQNRYRALVESLVNLVVSILLVKFTPLGITGVFLGTTVCFLCGRIWMDAYILYKHWFKVSFVLYMLTYVIRMSITVATAFGCMFLSNLIFAGFGLSILSWIVCGLICVAISTAIILVLYSKSEEFTYVAQIVKKLIFKRAA